MSDITYSQLIKPFRPTKKRIKNDSPILASKEWISNSHWAVRRDIIDYGLEVNKELKEDGSGVELFNSLSDKIREDGHRATLENKIKMPFIGDRPMIKMSSKKYTHWFDLYYFNIFSKLETQGHITKIYLTENMAIFKGFSKDGIIGCLMSIKK